MAKANFWGKLERPILALAPMAEITDAAFRRLVAKHGKPDVMFTEFVSCEGLCSPNAEKLLDGLIYDEIERPIVAQLFGKNPRCFYESATLVRELGFDGIDINMGCPDRNVCRQGAGAALITNPELTKEIIWETKRGAQELPVSVKTRIGYDKSIIEDWAGHLLETKPAAITFHLRTQRESSLAKAHWEEIEPAVNLARGTGTIILGNGDVTSLNQALELVQRTGVDGVMIGRAALGNPWLFDRSRKSDDIRPHERLRAMREHALTFEEIFRQKRNFVVMRKLLMPYVSGLPEAARLRTLLGKVSSATELAGIISEYMESVLPNREIAQTG